MLGLINLEYRLSKRVCFYNLNFFSTRFFLIIIHFYLHFYNQALEDKQELIDIIETVYRGARKGRGLVVSPKDYSTKYKY